MTVKELIAHYGDTMESVVICYNDEELANMNTRILYRLSCKEENRGKNRITLILENQEVSELKQLSCYLNKNVDEFYSYTDDWGVNELTITLLEE